MLARSAFRKEVHTTTLYAVLSRGVRSPPWDLDRRPCCSHFVLVPVVISIVFGEGTSSGAARWPKSGPRSSCRAEEVLTQEELAPQRWAARLAPEVLPDITGFELGKVYKAGTGLMAGDFYDVFRVRQGSPRSSAT